MQDLHGFTMLQAAGRPGIYILQFLTALKLLSKLVQLGLKVRPEYLAQWADGGPSECDGDQEGGPGVPCG